MVKRVVSFLKFTSCGCAGRVTAIERDASVLVGDDAMTHIFVAMTRIFVASVLVGDDAMTRIFVESGGLLFCGTFGFLVGSHDADLDRPESSVLVCRRIPKNI